EGEGGWRSGGGRGLQGLGDGGPSVGLRRLSTLDRQALDAQVAADGNGGAVWNLHPTCWIQKVRRERNAAASTMGPDQRPRVRGGAGNPAALAARRALQHQVVKRLGPLMAGDQHPPTAGHQI